MKLAIAKGTTNFSVDVFIQDSSSTTGAGLTSLVFNSAGLTAYYHRPGAVAAALSLTTQTVTGAHSGGGFVEIDATNMPGLYRLDLSDAIVASGVDSVTAYLQGATNMAPVVLELQLTDVDLNDGVRGGMTALPNAAADGAGGLPISDGGGLALDTQLAATNEVTAARMGALTDWIDGGRLDLLLDAVKAVTDNLPDSGALNDLAAILTDTGTTLPATLGSPVADLATDLAGVQADTTEILTRVPNATPGGNGGLPTVDANNRVAGMQGTKNTLDDLNDLSFANVWTGQMTESYAANGVAPTPAQAFFGLQGMLFEKAASSTTLTVYELDGITVAMTFTLNDASAPTAISRTT